MNDDLDKLLARISAQAPHPGLEELSAAVLDHIAASPIPRRDTFLATSAVAALVAVGVGFAGGAIKPAHAQAPTFNPAWALAPSTLLVGS